MKAFYCNAINNFCSNIDDCPNCEYTDNSGGRDVELNIPSNGLTILKDGISPVTIDYETALVVLISSGVFDNLTCRELRLIPKEEVIKTCLEMGKYNE